MKEKTKEILNKVINSSFFIIILAIFIILKTILFYKSTVCINEKIDIKTIQSSIIYILSLFGILCVLPKKGRNIGGIVLDAIVSIILFADNIYYTYSSNVLSVLQITNLQYGEEIMSTLPMLLKLHQILYFIDILLLVILFVSKFVKIEKGEKSKLQYIVSRTFIGLFAIYVFITSAIEGNEKALEDPYNRDTQIKKATIYGYHISDLLNAIDGSKQAKYRNKTEVMEAYNSLKEEYNQEYEESYLDIAGSMEGKNVIVLHYIVRCAWDFFIV